MAERGASIRLVTCLSKLERCQIMLGKAKMLNQEEDRIVDVEPLVLIKTDLEAARLCTCLVDLEAATKDFASYAAAVPATDLEGDLFKPYGFVNAIKVLDEMCKLERNKAADYGVCCL